MALAKLAGKLSKKLTSKQKIAAQARKVKGKEAADLGTPSDTVRREHVLGQREDKGGRKSSYQDTLPQGSGRKAKSAWRSKLKKQDKWGDELEANEKKIDELRAQLKKTDSTKGFTAAQLRISTQINNLKKKNKDLKEKLGQGRISMTDMKRRRGPTIQVKKGGTVKRKAGGSIGMGAALRGGGAVRKKG
jgi:hypothetical protein